MATEATDAARAKADELGVDIETVKGTGSEGRVTVSDVEGATSARETPVETGPATAPSTMAAVAAEDRPLETDSEAGVLVEPNPLLRARHGVVIPGVGHFVGGERISQSEFDRLEKEARSGPTVDNPEGTPLLVEKKEA